MDTIDVTNHMFEKVEVFGKPALYTCARVDKDTVPEGAYCYALRHGDDFGVPCAIEESVRANYFGALITTEPLDFADKNYIPLKYEDFVYTREHLTVEEFKTAS